VRGAGILSVLILDCSAIGRTIDEACEREVPGHARPQP